MGYTFYRTFKCTFMRPGENSSGGGFMKKIALLVAVLMVAVALPVWSMPDVLDRQIDHTMKSDIGPVADAGRILDFTNKGITKGYDMVTTPMKPVLDPIRTVRDETMHGAKLVVNTLWDFITFKHFRK